MVYDARDYWDFGLCPLSGIVRMLKNITFLKLDLISSSGEGVGDTSPVGFIRKS
jgi:hypothetical protein